MTKCSSSRTVYLSNCRALAAYWPLAGGQIQLAGREAALSVPEAALGLGLDLTRSRPHGGWRRCMLIYALTGQLWTIQLIRAVPTILLCKTQPTKDSGMGKRHKTQNKNQQYSNKTRQHATTVTTQSDKSHDVRENTHRGRRTSMHRGRGVGSDGRSETCTIINKRRRSGGGWEESQTVVAAPVYVDAAAVVAGELCEGEAGGVGCGETTPPSSHTVETTTEQNQTSDRYKLTNRRRRAHRTGRRSRRPGHTSRRWGCRGRWRTRTDWTGKYELKGKQPSSTSWETIWTQSLEFQLGKILLPAQRRPNRWCF